jgi:hypothetical protein
MGMILLSLLYKVYKMHMVKEFLKQDMLPIKKMYLVLSFMVDKGIMETLEDHTRG